MKKILLLLALTFGMAGSAKALTYEEAFDAIKALPQMKGVQSTVINGQNDFASIGVTNAELVLWDNEGQTQTEIYGNAIYRVMGELPVSEMIQCKITDSAIFAIFAKPISAEANRIIILSDSAFSGFTGAIIGYISNDALDSLRTAILTPRPDGGTALYLNVLNF